MEIAIISIIVSGIALLASLYFNFVSNSNTALNRYNDCIADIDRILINDPELMAIYDNNKIEKRRQDETFMCKIEAFTYLHFNYFENAYFHFLRKPLFLFGKQKKSWRSFILLVFENPLCISLFNENKKLYDKDFVKYIDKLLLNKIT